MEAVRFESCVGVACLTAALVPLASLVGAFQGDRAGDYDPRQESGLALHRGYPGPTNGGSIIYLETSRDRAVQAAVQFPDQNITLQIVEQNTVVHEVGHAIGGYAGGPIVSTLWPDSTGTSRAAALGSVDTRPSISTSFGKGRGR